MAWKQGIVLIDPKGYYKIQINPCRHDAAIYLVK